MRWLLGWLVGPVFSISVVQTAWTVTLVLWEVRVALPLSTRGQP